MEGGHRKQSGFQEGVLIAVMFLIKNHILVKRNESLEETTEESRNRTTGYDPTYADLANYAIRAHEDKRIIAGSTGVGSDHVGSHDLNRVIIVDIKKYKYDPKKIASTIIHEAAHGHGFSEKRCQYLELKFFENFDKPKE